MGVEEQAVDLVGVEDLGRLEGLFEGKMGREVGVEGLEGNVGRPVGVEDL